MSKNYLELAVVGTGGIANAHYTNLAALGDNKIVATAEIDETRRKTVAAKLGARSYADFKEMIRNEPSLDAVILATPPAVRGEVFAAAAARSRPLPVFCEKPPARTRGDARAVVALIGKSGLPTSVGFMYRYFPAVDYLKALIKDQPINQVQSAFMCPALTIWNLPGWFKIKEVSGGHVLDQAIHVMDLIRFIAGDITEVYTVGTNALIPKSADTTIEDSSSTTLRFASGASGTHAHSWSHRHFFGEVNVYGKDFRLTLALDSRVHGYVGDEKIDRTFETQPAGATHHYLEMKTFLDAVRTGDFTAVRSPYPDAAKSLATVLAMNESIDRGTPVKVEA